MGPVWRRLHGTKTSCDRCGREVDDYAAVGRVVDFEFRPDQRYCWDCYAYIKPFVDDVEAETQLDFEPVTKPAIP
jgi:hypothetical protein